MLARLTLQIASCIPSTATANYSSAFDDDEDEDSLGHDLVWKEVQFD
jgi:hypothetical protein